MQGMYEKYCFIYKAEMELVVAAKTSEIKSLMTLY